MVKTVYHIHSCLILCYPTKRIFFIIVGKGILLLGMSKFYFLLHLQNQMLSLHCEVRELAKHKHVPLLISNKRSTFPFQLVHTNLQGPSTVPNVSNAQWFVTFIDNCPYVTWLFLLKHKSSVSTVFPSFFFMVKNKLLVLWPNTTTNEIADRRNGHLLNQT